MSTVEAQNKDANANAATFTQQATSGGGSAVKAVSNNTAAPALHVCGAGDLISAKDSAGAEQFKVAQSGNVTADGDLTVTTGSLVVGTVGQGLNIKEGSNAKMGTATMVAGSVVVSTTAVAATSRIQLTVQSLGTVTAPKAIAVTARTAATSFTITSADNTDTSVVAWVILTPAA